MKINIYKFFADYEKEEKWLNEMAASGYAFTNFSFFRYTFTECEPGEFIYRIELLDNLPSHPVSMNYIRFLEDTDIELVSTWFRWVYFKKPAANGGFDLYSDIDSKIKHIKRMFTLYVILLFANFAPMIGNFFTWYDGGNGLTQHRFPFFLISLPIVVLMSKLSLSCLVKINKLQKVKTLRE